MVNFVEKKRVAYLSLLEITEDIRILLQNDDINSISEVIGRRDEAIRRIAAMDEEIAGNEILVAAKPAEINEVLVLIKRIAEINESLIMNVSEKMKIVGREIYEMSRGTNAIAKYARIGAM